MALIVVRHLVRHPVGDARRFLSQLAAGGETMLASVSNGVPNEVPHDGARVRGSFQPDRIALRSAWDVGSGPGSQPLSA